MKVRNTKSRREYFPPAGFRLFQKGTPRMAVSSDVATNRLQNTQARKMTLAILREKFKVTFLISHTEPEQYPSIEKAKKDGEPDKVSPKVLVFDLAI